MPAPAAPAAVAPAPDPTIDLADIPDRAQRVETDLAGFADLNNTRLMAEIEQGLPQTRERIQQVTRRLLTARKHKVSAQRLTAVRSNVESIHRQLTDWQTGSGNMVTQLEGAIIEVDEMSVLWERTRDAAIANNAPGTVVTQLRATISSINRSRTELGDNRIRALETLGDVGIELRKLARMKIELDEMLIASRANLLRRDSPPIWEVFRTPHTASRTTEEFGRFIKENFAVFGHWASVHIVSLVAWLGVFAFTLTFIISVRRQHLDRLVSDERLQTTSTLVHHPFSTSVLIALLFVPILLRERTEAFGWLVVLLAVPALLRLIPTLIPLTTRPMARSIIGVYVLARFGYMFPESSNAARLLYILAELIIVVGGIKYLRRVRGDKTGRPLITAITRVMVLAALGAFIAHVLGLSLLGTTLVQGASSSAFLGLALMSIATLASAFFRLLCILGPLRHLESVKRHYDVMENQFKRILFWFAIIIWFLNTLRAFTVQEITFEFVQEWMNREWQFGSLVITIGAIFWFVLSVWIAVVVSRLLRFFLENDVLSRLGLPRGVPSTISMMLHYGIVTLGLLVALAALGVETSQLSILIGALGVGIGFGLQNVVNNFISGLILIFERPINVGDIVQFNTTTGKVSRIGLRSSIVRAFDGAEIIVPNGDLISKEVTNWTLSDENRRILLLFRVTFGTDPDKVIAILERVAGEHDMILQEPAPWAVFDGYGESFLNFSLRCWATSDVMLRAKSSLSVKLDDALRKEGITIAVPKQEMVWQDRKPADPDKSKKS